MKKYCRHMLSVFVSAIMIAAVAVPAVAGDLLVPEPKPVKKATEAIPAPNPTKSADTQVQDEAKRLVKDSGIPQGQYNSCTKNPFALCSGGRPGPKDPMRGCFDSLC